MKKNEMCFKCIKCVLKNDLINGILVTISNKCPSVIFVSE